MSEIEIELTTSVYGGDAMGRTPDGRAVFVPFALPGERVRARLVEEKRNFARAELLEVLVPARERILPRCPHFGTCGGCHYQQLDYPSQLHLKTRILRDQLVRIAGIADPPLGAIVPSPSPWNYRNTLQFHLDPQGRFGFQAAGGRGVLAVRECHLPEPALNAFWPGLELEPVPGLERISMRLGAGDEILLALEGDEMEAPEVSIEELPVSVVYLGPGGSLVMAGDDAVVMVVLERPFRVSAGSFFQVNTPMAEAMVGHVLGLLDPQPNQVVLDLYCGAGLFSAFLAPLAGAVIGLELSPSACADFAVNLDDFENVSLYEGAAEDILPHLDLRIDSAVVDPPRAGLERTALDALLALRPRRLVYVSCDPATLARDAKRLLVGGYQLSRITPFDLFPQTYHIESIALFEPTS